MAGASQTCVIELGESSSHLASAAAQSGKYPQNVHTLNQLSTQNDHDGELTASLPSPITSVEVLQKWNSSTVNMYRTMAAFWSLLLIGANDAAYGPLIPYLEKYYNLTYTVVSLIFLSPFVGYIFSATFSDTIHRKFGQRGVALIGPTAHIIPYIVLSLHPPYPVLVVVFMITGFGNGLTDSAWNTWIGNMANANEMLGFLNAFYGLGGVLSPLIATALITKAQLPWYTYYYLMTAGAVIELISCTAAFWKATGQKYREMHPAVMDSKNNPLKEALFTAPSARVTWLCSMFLLCYVGVEVALGGWIVTFMIQVRNTKEFESGMTATGFWLGITVGRVVLGFVTPRIGERSAIAIYLPCAMALQLLFWLVPQFIVSAIAVAFQGFFLGPMFPAAIVAATKLLPRRLHVSAIGFAAAFGSGGAAILPFAIGAIAQSKGVQVLQPIVIAILVVLVLLWLALPRLHKRQE